MTKEQEHEFHKNRTRWTHFQRLIEDAETVGAPVTELSVPILLEILKELQYMNDQEQAARAISMLNNQ